MPNGYHGKITAEWLAKTLNGKGKIVMASGMAGTDTAEVRLEQARAVFAQFLELAPFAHLPLRV